MGRAHWRRLGCAATALLLWSAAGARADEVSGAAAAVEVSGTEPAPEASGRRPEVRLADDKLRIEWGDTAKFAIGGLFQGDWGYFEKGGPVTPQGWEGQVRRARVQADGLFVDRYFFRLQYDFSGTNGRISTPQIDYKDVYIGVRGLGPVGTFRFGHMKEPYSLQHLTNSADRVFMEEGLSTVLTPGRNTGITFNHHLFDQRMTWAVGGFRNVTEQKDFFGNSGEYDVAFRITGLPWYREEGRKFFHIGAAYIHQFRPDDTTARYRQRPEANIADAIRDTGPILISGQDQFGVELAFNYGPFESQLEMSVAYQQRTGDRPTHFKAAYVQAAYFLTGEHRPYDTETGIFERVRPIRPFSIKGGGWGAWQVGLRYSYMDLNSDDFRGGVSQQVGVALNWFLLSSVRLSMNYFYVAPLNDGSSSVFQMRAQLDF